VRFETVTRDVKTQAVSGAPNTVWVQDGAVRSSSGPQHSMILKAGTLYVIDDQKKTYMEMDKATMQAMAAKAKAALAQMQERMKSLPPEQRAMMEKMMQGKLPGAGASAAVFDTKNTFKTDMVEGRKCTIWNMLKDGQIIAEICAVPFNTLPGKEDLQKSFKELGEAFEGLASMAPDGSAEIKVRNSIDGYPVRTRTYLNGKPTDSENVLKSWSEEAIPAVMFDVPKGYTRREMPQFGAG
jgi:hypothetical protein